MATAYHNLSDYDFNSVPDAADMRFGIVVSEWNYNITGALLAGAVKTRPSVQGCDGVELWGRGFT